MIRRVKKNQNYTVIDNEYLTNANLSLKAKGLLTIMLSFPNDWKFSISFFISTSKDNYDSVRNALNNLKENGYLEIIPSRDTQGKFSGYVYKIYENNRKLGSPKTGKPKTENATLLNTNITKY